MLGTENNSSVILLMESCCVYNVIVCIEKEQQKRTEHYVGPPDPRDRDSLNEDRAGGQRQTTPFIVVYK